MNQFQILTLVFTACILIMASFCKEGLTASSRTSPAEIKSILVPDPIDSSHEAVVIVDVRLSESCYELGQTDVAVDSAAKVIAVDQAQTRTEDWCRPLVSHFSKRVKLGKLENGTYKLIGNHGLFIGSITVPSQTLALSSQPLSLR